MTSDIKIEETIVINTHNKNYMSTQIDTIINENIIDDLKKKISKRTCLNKCNVVLIYIFHLLQACGIIITAVSSTYKINDLIWIGIACNSVASIIIIYEKINQGILIILLNDIKLIRNGNYIDDAPLVDINNKN